MRITSQYGDESKVWETHESEVYFGRAEGNWPTVLDLSPDLRVSRLHGRIWEEDGGCWIEDLNSSRGTLLNGSEIKGLGKRRFGPTDSVLVGQTVIRVQIGEPDGDGETNYLEHGSILLPEKHHATSGLAIAKDLDATAVETGFTESPEDPAARRLKTIRDLPFQFATKTSLRTLLPAVVDQLTELIPSGESWAVVLREEETDTLLLKAFRHVRRTYLSETLLRRAMTDRKAFVWKRGTEVNVSDSVAQSGMEIGMYAPLLWQGKALGAICTGTQNPQAVFSDEDVRLLVIVGQYAAMAVATHQLQEKLRQESVVRSGLLRQFSPKVAEKIRTERGRPRLGAQRNEVTILIAGFRDLETLGRDLEPDRLMEMIGEYLRAMVPVIFEYKGAIDRFSGDAIVAFFGVPEIDSYQQENAVRAAIGMQGALTKLNESRAARSEYCQQIAIGIHSGEAVSGFVGNERPEFTVIGDVVGRAASLCAKAAPGEVLISPEVHERIGTSADAERVSLQSEQQGDVSAYRVRSSSAIAHQSESGATA